MDEKPSRNVITKVIITAPGLLIRMGGNMALGFIVRN